MSGTLAGGCFCRKVRYRLTSEPMFVHCCHCRNCQSQTGSAFVLNALIETDRIEKLSGEPEATRVWSVFGPFSGDLGSADYSTRFETPELELGQPTQAELQATAEYEGYGAMIESIAKATLDELREKHDREK